MRKVLHGVALATMLAISYPSPANIGLAPAPAIIYVLSVRHSRRRRNHYVIWLETTTWPECEE